MKPMLVPAHVDEASASAASAAHIGAAMLVPPNAAPLLGTVPSLPEHDHAGVLIGVAETSGTSRQVVVPGSAVDRRLRQHRGPPGSSAAATASRPRRRSRRRCCRRSRRPRSAVTSVSGCRRRPSRTAGWPGHRPSAPGQSAVAVVGARVARAAKIVCPWVAASSNSVFSDCAAAAPSFDSHWPHEVEITFACRRR